MADVPQSQPLGNPPQGIYSFGYHLQGMNEDASKFSDSTVLIRHLPEAIPDDTLSRLFSHYGASSVRRCNNGRVRNCAFVDFPNEALASQAQRQLNGLRFLGKVLSVERARKSLEDVNHEQRISDSRKETLATNKAMPVAKDQRQGPKLAPAGEPIAEKLGVDYPFPPQLEYVYPPPDGNILTNILNALIAVPRFYVQVLHLMNKMNIPAPFRAALPTPPLPPSAVAPSPPPPPPPADANHFLEDVSSGESEMESSDEEGVGDKRSTKRKRIKRESIVGPAVDKDVAHEAVGLKPAVLVPKEIPLIKKKNPVLQIKITPKQIQNEQKDDDAIEGFDQKEKEDVNNRSYASLDELERGKLPPEEILSLPMFKNYNAGNPSPVLYIKNLAKNVVSNDFYFIFGTFFGSYETAEASLSVKLMQEGRMRGQAFVMFPSVELAHRALDLVNGYVLKGKPIIIQFGRNPTPSKSN